MTRPANMCCVHCDEPMWRSGEAVPWLYPLSGFAAHVHCVSQPSAADMDTLLIGYQAPSHVHRIRSV